MVLVFPLVRLQSADDFMDGRVFLMPATDHANQQALAEWARDCADDPLRFVLEGYPWGEPGPLEHHDGPDVWQVEALIKLREEVRKRAFDGVTAVTPIRLAISKGHGVGGSTFLAWWVDWIMSTRPHCRGTITANTNTQLETKTWPTVQKWTKLVITADWFTVTTTRMYFNDHKETWFCTPQTCREENSEAFAGQHAADSTSFYGFDEDSGIADLIHEVSEGGLTDGEPMQLRLGNPTRRSGSFYECIFGRLRDRWVTMVVDSRTSRYTNKTQIQEWLEDYGGEDSDFFRVRVRGLPPDASDAQFIDMRRIREAQRRPPMALPDDPLIAGLDVSDGGAAWTVCRFRRGMDGQARAPQRWSGEQSRDRQGIIAWLAEQLRETAPSLKIAALFVDSAFGSPIVERLHVLGFQDRVFEIRFGAPSPDQHYANQRAYQWSKMKDWLLSASIDAKDTRLEGDLSAPGFHLNKQDKLVLEAKESMAQRNVASPDDGDALSLTFAQSVNPAVAGTYVQPYRPRGAWS